MNNSIIKNSRFTVYCSITLWVSLLGQFAEAFAEAEAEAEQKNLFINNDKVMEVNHVSEVSPWSFNITLASQYVTRGITNSKGSPAVQGGVDYTDPSGWHAGFWTSTVSDELIQGATVETDYYAGYIKTIGDLKFGARIYYYIYPGAKIISDGKSDISQTYNYGEFVPSVSNKWLTAKYWYTYTKDFFGLNDETMVTTGRGHSGGSAYLDININYPIGNGFSLIAHYGHQNVKNYGARNWSDGKIGIGKSFDGGWSASLTATRTWMDRSYNLNNGVEYRRDKYKVSPTSDPWDPTKGNVVFSLTKVF